MLTLSRFNNIRIRAHAARHKKIVLFIYQSGGKSHRLAQESKLHRLFRQDGNAERAGLNISRACRHDANGHIDATAQKET